MNRKKIRFRLSLMEFIYNGCFAAGNFMSVFLEAIGFSAGQLGLITAFVSGISIVSQPTFGLISDRIRSVKRCFILCLVATALCALAIPALSQLKGAWLMAMVAMLMAMHFFFNPSNMMMELWLVRVNNNPELQIPYGSVRSWASIGYAAFSLAFVPILTVLHVRSVYYFLGGFAAVSCGLALMIPGRSEGGAISHKRQRLREMPFRSLVNYWIIGQIIFEILYQIPFGWRNTYLVFAIKELQADTSIFGALMFVSGICEVPMLLMIKRVAHRLGWAWPLVISVLIVALENVCYALGHSVVTLFAAQLLHGFGFALYVAARIQYINRTAPQGLEGSTQALINSISAVVNFIATAAGGFLVEAMGVRPFYTLLCGLQLLPGAFFVGLHFFGAKYLRIRPKDGQCALFS